MSQVFVAERKSRAFGDEPDDHVDSDDNEQHRDVDDARRLHQQVRSTRRSRSESSGHF